MYHGERSRKWDILEQQRVLYYIGIWIGLCLGRSFKQADVVVPSVVRGNHPAAQEGDNKMNKCPPQSSQL